MVAPVKMRLLTYNVLKGGQGREAEIVEVIRTVVPDVVVVQEVLEVNRFRRIATALEMSPYLAEGRGRVPLRVGLLSRLPVLDFRTLDLWPLWPSCLQATVRLANGSYLTVFGLHLLAGDFNTIAPGDRASLAQAPLWVKAQTWFQAGYITRWSLRALLDEGYVDCFRKMHPKKDGFTLPSPHPQVRLDYIFATPLLAEALRECRVITPPGKVASASDHLPVLAEFVWEA